MTKKSAKIELEPEIIEQPIEEPVEEITDLPIAEIEVTEKEIEAVETVAHPIPENGEQYGVHTIDFSDPVNVKVYGGPLLANLGNRTLEQVKKFLDDKSWEEAE